MATEPIELMSADVFEEGREAVREYHDHIKRAVFEAVDRAVEEVASRRLGPPGLEIFFGKGMFHELARRSGLSRSTVSGVLQGKRGASLETLRRLSEASGVELGRLTEYVDVQRKGRSK
jgi:hypothetical protein